MIAPPLTGVFTNGEDHFTCFFAPALVATPSGVLLAFSEGRGLRKRGCHDVGDVLIVWPLLSNHWTESLYASAFLPG